METQLYSQMFHAILSRFVQQSQRHYGLNLYFCFIMSFSQCLLSVMDLSLYLSGQLDQIDTYIGFTSPMSVLRDLWETDRYPLKDQMDRRTEMKSSNPFHNHLIENRIISVLILKKWLYPLDH